MASSSAHLTVFEIITETEMFSPGKVELIKDKSQDKIGNHLYTLKRGRKGGQSGPDGSAAQMGAQKIR